MQQQQELTPLGAYIRANLGNTPVSQASLDMGFAVSYLGQVINGQIRHPSSEKLLKIAEYLDVDFKILSALEAGASVEKHTSLQALLSGIIARMPINTELLDTDADRPMKISLDGHEYRVALPLTAREYTADEVIKLMRSLVALL